MWLFLHELELRIKPHVVGFGPLRARGREGFGERLRGDAFGKNEREAVDSWRSPDSNTGLTVMEGTLMGMFWTRSSLRRVPEGCQEFRIISGDRPVFTSLPVIGWGQPMGDGALVQMQCWAQHSQAAIRLLVWLLEVLQVQFPGYQNRRATSLSLSLLSDLK